MLFEPTSKETLHCIKSCLDSNEFINLPCYMQSIHKLECIDEISIEKPVNGIHATDLSCYHIFVHSYP